MAKLSSSDIDRSVDGTTVASAFLQTVAAHGDLVALRERGTGDEWLEWTYSEYAEHVAGAAAGLRALGVEAGDRVVLMMRNSVAFHMLDLAVVFCGATPISIYNSSSPEQVAYLTGHCDAKIGIVEDAGYLERFLKVHEELPALERLAIVNDPDGLAGADVWTFPQLVHEHGSIDLEEGASRVSPDTLATVIYTSGTTGPPKGVMMSHYNVMWTAESLKQAFGGEIDLTGYRVVSYLPMAHIAERMTSHYMQAINAYEITSCPDPGQIGVYFREVRPNVMFGVPRVWEKLHAGVMAAISADATRDAAVRRRGRGREADLRRPCVGEVDRRAGRDVELPPGRRVRPREEDVGSRPGAIRHLGRRADHPRVARMVQRHRRPVVGDLWHVRVIRPDDVGARADQARHGRPGDPGLRGDAGR